MITPTPRRSRLSLSCSQSKGSFQILSCCKLKSILSAPESFSLRSSFRWGFKGRCKGQGKGRRRRVKDGISFIENEKRPGIDLQGGGGGEWGFLGELRDRSDISGAFKNPSWHAYPFHTSWKHIELCCEQPVVAALPAAPAHVSLLLLSTNSSQHTAASSGVSAGARNFSNQGLLVFFEEESESKVRPEGLLSLPLLSDLEGH